MLTTLILAFCAATFPVVASEASPVEPELSSDEDAPAVEKWIGTLAVLGSRKVPLLGKVEFRTDTYVLATATNHGTAGG